MLVDLTDFLDHILAEVRLAPEDLAIQKLRIIIGDFCQFTRAWQEDGPPDVIVVGQATYDIKPDGDAEPCALEYLAVNDVEANPKSTEWLTMMVPTWRTRTADDFSVFTQLTRKTYTFSGKPVTGGGIITYRMALKPGPDSMQVDEDVWNEWHDVLAGGAKAELLVMEGERWANVKRGADYRVQYRADRTNARIRIAKAYGNADSSWISPYKFAGR